MIPGIPGARRSNATREAEEPAAPGTPSGAKAVAAEAALRSFQSFLADVEMRSLSVPGLPTGLRPVGLALGSDARGNALEIALLSSPIRPRAEDIRSVWRKRWDGRAAPVFVVVTYATRAALCGPNETDGRLHYDVSLDVVEALCRAALVEPDHHSARKFLIATLRTIDGPFAGLRNEGLLATHHVARNVPQRPDWEASIRRAIPVIAKREEALLDALGFEVEHTSQSGLVLRDTGTKVALALLVTRGTDVDASDPKFNGLSPVSYGLTRARQENLPYLLVTEGPTVRLYATDPAAGVGRRGGTETFIEARLDMLGTDRAGYLWLLFSAEALRRGGTLEKLLRESSDYATDLGTRLRDRIYSDVVPRLAAGLAEAMQVRNDAEQLRETYEIALTILFRLLFIAYAEDRLHLPYDANEQYRTRSLKTKARQLAEQARLAPTEEWDEQPTLWRELLALFEAVDHGKAAWGVPAYNGGLFSSDRAVSSIGASIHEIDLPDRVIGPLLRNLLVDATPDPREPPGPVDFRSLGVREFGTVYEGLLESDLAIAETDLAVDRDGAYRPVRRKSEAIIVAKGRPYLRNRSGARKSSGSFFTKSFIVDHLLEETLGPALNEHLARLDSLDDAEAAKQLFDFRVVDLAMGSGHFLVAAVDEIESAFSGYLARRHLPAVLNQLAHLRESAKEHSARVRVTADVEDAQLLRRQIARRCIYGVDFNRMAVELARLSLWVHTFVPGLPLSYLGHNLVRGNSLVGVATVDEAAEALGADAPEGKTKPLFGAGVRAMLEAGRANLEELADIADANRGEINAARAADTAARKKIAPLKAIFDYVTAMRIEPALRAELDPTEMMPTKVFSALKSPQIQARVSAVLDDSPPTHFPITFAEVFLRARAGFDVILGNPPWEELRVERDDFWTRHIPGLQGMPQRERERLISQMTTNRDDLVREYDAECSVAKAALRNIIAAGYPGMTTGDPDLYKAFAWRFWHLAARDGGRIGVVMPRTAWQAKGSAEFRRELFAKGDFGDITFVLNSGGWVFDDAEPRYTIALTSLKRTMSPGTTVPIRGPYSSLKRFQARTRGDGAHFQKDDLLSWTDTAALPLLPNEGSTSLFAQLRQSPRLDLNVPGQWRARPYREFHATDDKIGNKGNVIDVSSASRPKGSWPVYKGESFDLWNPDTGTYYGWANPAVAVPKLDQRRLVGVRRKESAFGEFVRADALGTLECKRPRIAFRDVTNRTNTRTVIAALIPPSVFLTNAAPFFLWPRGDEYDQAYLLGVLASRPLDWYARRFVETHVNYHIINPFPVPRPARNSRLRERVVQLAGRLACPDARFASFAKAVSVTHGPLKADEKQEMVWELDAVVARLYGLDSVQLRHVFETFHEGWDYEDELRGTLRHFMAWKKRGAD
ncbi:MAG: hypothetical protein KF850_20100 [Labilithrix sp.]|nr:hypothetical protein [Labilithrix sp.]